MKRRDAIKLLGARRRRVLGRSSVRPGAENSQGRISLSRSERRPAQAGLAAFREGLKAARAGATARSRSWRDSPKPSRRGTRRWRRSWSRPRSMFWRRSAYISVEAARAATKTIPIVASIWKPIRSQSGIAATLARPGGNITGVYFRFSGFQRQMDATVEGGDTAPRPASSCCAIRPIHAPQLKGIETGRRSPGRQAGGDGGRKPRGIRQRCFARSPSAVRMHC